MSDSLRILSRVIRLDPFSMSSRVPNHAPEYVPADQVVNEAFSAVLRQGRRQDPLYRIRKLLLMAAEQLTERG